MAALAVCSFTQAPVGRDVPEKPRLPNIELATIDGKAWKLHDNLGSIVVLNFWATWCAPCRTEIPILLKIGENYKKQDIRIFGVAVDESGIDVIKKFVDEYKIDYPILIPLPDSPFFNLDSMPTTLLIDSEGRLAEKYVGAFPEKLIRSDIEKLILKKAK